MAAPSSIDTLPPQLLEQLQAWLRDPAVTQLEATKRINSLCAEFELEPRSKSAVNRYAQRMEAVGKKIRERREIAKMWTAKIGEAPDGETGQLLIEIVRNIAMDLMFKLEGEAEKLEPKALKELTWAVEKLENASTINEKRRAEIERIALEKAAKAVEAVGKESGAKMQDVEKMVRAVYGIGG